MVYFDLGWIARVAAAVVVPSEAELESAQLLQRCAGDVLARVRRADDADIRAKLRDESDRLSLPPANADDAAVVEFGTHVLQMLVDCGQAVVAEAPPAGVTRSACERANCQCLHVYVPSSLPRAEEPPRITTGATRWRLVRLRLEHVNRGLRAGSSSAAAAGSRVFGIRDRNVAVLLATSVALSSQRAHVNWLRAHANRLEARMSIDAHASDMVQVYCVDRTDIVLVASTNAAEPDATERLAMSTTTSTLVGAVAGSLLDRVLRALDAAVRDRCAGMRVIASVPCNACASERVDANDVARFVADAASCALPLDAGEHACAHHFGVLSAASLLHDSAVAPAWSRVEVWQRAAMRAAIARTRTDAMMVPASPACLPSVRSELLGRDVDVALASGLSSISLLVNATLDTLFAAAVDNARARAIPALSVQAWRDIGDGKRAWRQHVYGHFSSLPCLVNDRGAMLVRTYHGTSRAIAESIARSGAVHVHSLKPRDYFGKGIYSTTYLEQALRYSGAERCVLVSYIVCHNMRPVVEQEAFARNAGEGVGVQPTDTTVAIDGYDANYVLVAPPEFVRALDSSAGRKTWLPVDVTNDTSMERIATATGKTRDEILAAMTNELVVPAAQMLPVAALYF